MQVYELTSGESQIRQLADFSFVMQVNLLNIVLVVKNVHFNGMLYTISSTGLRNGTLQLQACRR